MWGSETTSVFANRPEDVGLGAEYDPGVATEPDRIPLEQVLDEEVASIFEAGPEFEAGLRQTVEQVRRGGPTRDPSGIGLV